MVQRNTALDCSFHPHKSMINYCKIRAKCNNNFRSSFKNYSMYRISEHRMQLTQCRPMHGVAGHDRSLPAECLQAKCVRRFRKTLNLFVHFKNARISLILAGYRAQTDEPASEHSELRRRARNGSLETIFRSGRSELDYDVLDSKLIIPNGPPQWMPIESLCQIRQLIVVPLRNRAMLRSQKSLPTLAGVIEVRGDHGHPSPAGNR